MRLVKHQNGKYSQFGQKLVELRLLAGISSQDELAKRMQRSQQSVSRWEAGSSRPRPGEVVGLSALLDADADELLSAAGYKPTSSSTGIITFDKPLPLENLPPEAFERFLVALLGAIYPKASIKRAGVSGHKQDGVDVTVRFEDGSTYSFQCKRVQNFGPANVREAIQAHTIKADRKFLVLSRVASPKANLEVAKYRDWEIWDKEDLSQKLRSLPNEPQDRIVDTYFPGRRFELLGRAEPGPWLTCERFFESFEARDAAFSHSWALKGREDDLASLEAALNDSTVRLTLVTAAGGLGKSRLIREGVQAFELSHAGTLVYFLSPTRSPTPRDFEALGNGPKLLVVDDAHDREDMGPLFEYAAAPSNQAHLLLASRPYGSERVKGQAAVFGLNEPRTITIKPLSRVDLLALAAEVLSEFNADPQWAEYVVGIASDSPLITVMAARVMAKERIQPALISSQETLKNFVLGKFEKVVLGDLGSTSDQPLLARLLELFALIQPFDPQEPFFDSLLETVIKLDKITASRLISLLANGGIIFKRGRHFRLMPDVLGDYLIDRSCIGADGSLSPFAESVYDVAQNTQIGRILLNLGRLDWRRSEGDPSESKLLNGIWRKLDTIRDEHDPRLKAIYEAASYQPRKALDFVQRQLQVGHRWAEFSRILRRVAYTHDNFGEACALLWEIGRTDVRELSRNPDHPIRILSELVELEEQKPFEFVKRAFEFGMGLMQRQDAWTGAYSPLDVVAPIFKGEGIHITSNVTHFTYSPFLVRYDLVAPLRECLIDRLLVLMRGNEPHAGQEAAKLLAEALRSPMGAMGTSVPMDLYALYNDEFVKTLGKIHDALRDGIKPAVAISIAKAVSWHASYGTGQAAEAAKAILSDLPNDLEFRTWVALVDGSGQLFLGRWKPDTWEGDTARWITVLVEDLKVAYPKQENLRAFIEYALVGLTDAALDQNANHVLIVNLLRDDLLLARAFIEDAMMHPESSTTQFVSFAITEILTISPDEGRQLARTLLNTEISTLRIATGHAYGGLRRSPDNADFALLMEIVADRETAVVGAAFRSSFAWWNEDPVQILTVARHANIGESDRVANDMCMLLAKDKCSVLGSATAVDAKILLDKLLPIPELDGYWISEVLAHLSEYHAIAVVELFFQRIECYSNSVDFTSYRPVERGLHHQVKLRFRKSPDAPEIFRRTWHWLKEHDTGDQYLRYNTSHLFEMMFQPIDHEVIAMLAEKVEEGASEDLQLIARLMRNVPPMFVFSEQAFVLEYLERCKITDAKILSEALVNFLISATSGARSGLVGQPAPQDVRMKEGAETVLASISRLSPAYGLYNDIRAHAVWSIERSLLNGIEIEEE